MDVQTPNGFYTSQNNRSCPRNIASCLDRFLVLESFLIGEGEIEAIMMPTASSDQWPIYLEWRRLGELIKRLFHFEKFFVNPS